MSELVLSLFPGIGLLDMAFEEEGFTIVRGPDPLWGGDVRRFRPPADVFDGVIGGPPCQVFTELVHLVRNNGDEPKFGDLIPEFARCVIEAQPDWFLMENVVGAYAPDVPGYMVQRRGCRDVWCGGATSRERSFWFGSKSPAAFHIETQALHSIDVEPAVTGDMRVNTNGARVRKKPGGGVLPHVGALAPFEHMLRLQGLPLDFLEHAPFTSKAKRQAVGNGVPLAMGRAVAKAVRAAVTAGDTA